jgi:Zn-finger protein
MDDLTRNCIEKRIKIIIEEFNYNKRKKEHPEECPCNGTGPCHKIEDLNCFFCFCPEYNLTAPEGGCLAENPLGTGKWLDRSEYGLENIWDCSNCTYPHQEKVIKEVLTNLFYGKLSK